mmetsp:Transcript_62352/g.134113  ORF Transcript_62352/g.134113 Transcript_62352/m.134113 type:complete len:275 (+) Transcript_62352:66-890(+)
MQSGMRSVRSRSGICIGWTRKWHLRSLLLCRIQVGCKYVIVLIQTTNLAGRTATARAKAPHWQPLLWCLPRPRALSSRWVVAWMASADGTCKWVLVGTPMAGTSMAGGMRTRATVRIGPHCRRHHHRCSHHLQGSRLASRRGAPQSWFTTISRQARVAPSPWGPATLRHYRSPGSMLQVWRRRQAGTHPRSVHPPWRVVPDIVRAVTTRLRAVTTRPRAVTTSSHHCRQRRPGISHGRACLEEEEIRSGAGLRCLMMHPAGRPPWIMASNQPWP